MTGRGYPYYKSIMTEKRLYLYHLYARAVAERRYFTPEEKARVDKLVHDLHRLYRRYYGEDFVPFPELRKLINRYHYGDGTRQWGLHMGRAVTAARVSTGPYVPLPPIPFPPIEDHHLYRELHSRLDAEASPMAGGIDSDELGSEVTAVPLDGSNGENSGPVKRAGDYSSNEEQGSAPAGPRSFFPHPIPLPASQARPAVVDLTKSSDDDSE